MARSLNAQLSAIGAYAAYGNWVTVDPLTDRLVFTGVAKTAAADVTFGAANVHTCADVIGVPINTTDNGGVADPANAVNEGTFVWLSDPSNFLHITVTSDPGTNNQGIRTYSEFNKDRDRVEMITYAWTDALIEDSQSMVKIRDLRTQGIAI